MKTKLFLIATVSVLLLACASPEERAARKADSTEQTPIDPAVDSISRTDTMTTTSSLSGTQGTGNNKTVAP